MVATAIRPRASQARHWIKNGGALSIDALVWHCRTPVLAPFLGCRASRVPAPAEGPAALASAAVLASAAAASEAAALACSMA